MRATTALAAPSAQPQCLAVYSSGPRAPLRPGAAPRRRLPSPPQAAAKSAGPKDADQEAPAPAATSPPASSVGTALSKLAGRLLMNAASLRVVRAQTYCVHCRGTGRVTCSACQGAGIVQNEPVRMNQMKHAAGKVQQLLGMSNSKMHDGDWQLTNRCKRCHGTGALPCMYCDGTGTLGPQPRN